MKPHTIAAIVIAIGASTLGILAEEDSLPAKSEEQKREEAQARFKEQERIQEKIRKEIATSKEMVLPKAFADSTKWKLTDHYPPEGLVQKAYGLLKGAGHKDLMKEGALYYAVGEDWHILVITSTGSSSDLAKYYCLAYDSRSKNPIDPDKVWVKYRELIYKDTNAQIILKPEMPNK